MKNDPDDVPSDQPTVLPDVESDGQFLLPLPARDSFLSYPTAPRLKRPRHPVWTENKASLIERYLYYFVLITHHGTYIDGFAGPQQSDKPQMWAAKLVLESEPMWFRHFYLFDVDKQQANALDRLRQDQPSTDSKGRKLNRDIEVACTDFNKAVHDLLARGEISQKEATFCLLDQRGVECHWSTVRALSEYKRNGELKIELFYFFANAWIKRTLSGFKKNEKEVAEWWGRGDWQDLSGMRPQAMMETLVSHFKCELGYKTATPWPIYEREGGGRTMYHMIHATDHEAAPHLMARAYEKAVQPKETPEQLGFPEFAP